MKCLAVNTANSVLSVALCDGEEAIYYFETIETRDQGGLLLGHVEKSLAAAGMGYSGIDLMAVATGPGSFTGIRIGIAAMRALAMAAEKPLIGISSFDLFSVKSKNALNIVVLESWREELYFRTEGQAPVNQSPAAFAETCTAEFGEVVISGDASHKLAAFLPEATLWPRRADARDLAAQAAAVYKAEGTAAAKRPVPFYLRPADVTISASKNRAVEGADKA